MNTATHLYAPSERVRIQGWRRIWRQVAHHPVAILSAVPDTGSAIDGLIAPVADNNWAALDAREQGYDRLTLSSDALPQSHHHHTIAIYAVPASIADANPHKHPILLSYLDVVLQGYPQQFGPQGAEQFRATTDGWDRPILDDRAAPQYPRHQTLQTPQSTGVDAAITRWRSALHGPNRGL